MPTSLAPVSSTPGKKWSRRNGRLVWWTAAVAFDGAPNGEISSVPGTTDGREVCVALPSLGRRSNKVRDQRMRDLGRLETLADPPMSPCHRHLQPVLADKRLDQGLDFNTTRPMQRNTDLDQFTRHLPACVGHEPKTNRCS